MVIEACSHEHASFITLTYDQENLPHGGTLVPGDLQLWLKRLRKQHKLPLRFYAVGEYGDQTWRPHYHVALYGLGRNGAGLIRETWGKGLTDTGDLTLQSARYLAGYVTKKLTRPNDPRLSPGIHPEFARMSLRPGIGASGLPSIAAGLRSKAGQQLLTLSGDVPSMLRNGRNSLPLDRYLRKGLRDVLAFTPSPTPHETRARYAKMLALYANSGTTQTFTSYQRERYQQKILQSIKKQKIYSSKGTL